MSRNSFKILVAISLKIFIVSVAVVVAAVAALKS